MNEASSGRLLALIDRNEALDDEDGPKAIENEVEWAEITQKDRPAKCETDPDQDRPSDDIPHVQSSRWSVWCDGTRDGQGVCGSGVVLSDISTANFQVPFTFRYTER